jgi:hypothetical protein
VDQKRSSPLRNTDWFLLCGVTDVLFTIEKQMSSSLWNTRYTVHSSVEQQMFSPLWKNIYPLLFGTTDVLSSVETGVLSSVVQHMDFSSVENRCPLLCEVTDVLSSVEQQMGFSSEENRCLSSALIECHGMSSFLFPSYNRRPDKIPPWDQICPSLKGCIFSLLLPKSSRRLLFLCPKLVGPSSVLLQRCQIISHWRSEASLQRYPSSLGYPRIYLLLTTTKTDVLLAVQQ